MKIFISIFTKFWLFFRFQIHATTSTVVAAHALLNVMKQLAPVRQATFCSEANVKISTNVSIDHVTHRLYA